MSEVEVVPVVLAAVTLLITALATAWVATRCVTRTEHGEAVLVVRNGRARSATVEGWSVRVPLLEQFERVSTRPRPLEVAVDGISREGIPLTVTVVATVHRSLPRAYNAQTQWWQVDQAVGNGARDALADRRYAEVAVSPTAVAAQVQQRCAPALAAKGIALADVGLRGLRSPTAASTLLADDHLAHRERAGALTRADTEAEVVRRRARARADEIRLLDEAVASSDPATVDLLRAEGLARQADHVALFASVHPTAPAATSGRGRSVDEPDPRHN